MRPRVSESHLGVRSLRAVARRNDESRRERQDSYDAEARYSPTIRSVTAYSDAALSASATCGSRLVPSISRKNMYVPGWPWTGRDMIRVRLTARTLNGSRNDANAPG